MDKAQMTPETLNDIYTTLLKCGMPECERLEYVNGAWYCGSPNDFHPDDAEAIIERQAMTWWLGGRGEREITVFYDMAARAYWYVYGEGEWEYLEPSILEAICKAAEEE